MDQKEIKSELNSLFQRLEQSTDPYMLALLANICTLFGFLLFDCLCLLSYLLINNPDVHINDKRAAEVMQKLITYQKEDGHIHGAKTSATKSVCLSLL